MINNFNKKFKQLPKEIIDYIHEFNPDHRIYMKRILEEINSKKKCLYCDKKINNIIYILPSKWYLCNNLCYRKFRRKMYKINSYLFY
jgi:hypothetical protein